jgi:hypothetical protein
MAGILYIQLRENELLQLMAVPVTRRGGLD